MYLFEQNYSSRENTIYSTFMREQRRAQRVHVHIRNFCPQYLNLLIVKPGKLFFSTKFAIDTFKLMYMLF